MIRRRKMYRMLLSMFLLMILAVFMIPIVWNLAMSFDADVLTEIPKPPRFWPKTPSLRNYEYAFGSIPLSRYFANTTFLTVVNTAINVFFALCAGYAFSKGRFMLKRFWFLFVLAVMMIPFESIMVPLFLQYQKWGMLNTYAPLILGSFAYPFGIFMARSNMDQIPDALREAAFLDGASEWRTFLTVILPLCGPVTATLCILQVISQWNSFLWPLIVIQDMDKYVISVGVSLFNAEPGISYFGPRMAVSVLSALPMVIMFLFLQKYIVASVAMSGIKQ